MGAETELVVKVGDVPLTVLTHGRPRVQAGDQLKLEPDVAHVHLFDAASGSRL